MPGAGSHSNPIMTKDADDRRGSSVPLLWLLLITAAALALRIRYIGSQIISGDELHLLVVITTRTFTEIPGTVTGFDYSIPLALFFRALSDFLPLTEIMLRTPMLVCGCLSPALAALLARRFVSSRLAIALACVMAVHPLFIFYSRFVRPYAICLALLLLVLWSADRWATERRHRWLAAAALLSALACWFQPIALITVGLIFLGVLVREAWMPRSRPGTGEAVKGRPLALIVSGISALALTLLLFAPALGELVKRMVMDKVGVGNLTREIILTHATALVGMSGTIPMVCFFLFVICGSALLAMRLRSRSLLLLLPLFGQPAVILLLRPSLIDLPLVLARYQLYVLPIACLAACVFMAEVGLRIRQGVIRVLPGFISSRHAGPAIAVLLAALWILVGPYFSIYTHDNAYAHHYLFQTFRHETDPFWQAARGHASLVPLHPYYSTIYAARDSIPVVIEWPPPMDFTKMTYHVAQAFHTCALKIAGMPGEPWWSDQRLALRNVVDLTNPEFLPDMEPGTVVLLHKNPSEETAWFALGRSTHAAPKPQHVRAYDEIFRHVSSLLGPPIFEDRFLVAFRR
ncbi:MAG: glycosyltransferase family 39 protein [Planctomycetota bacterium]